MKSRPEFEEKHKARTFFYANGNEISKFEDNAKLFTHIGLDFSTKSQSSNFNFELESDKDKFDIEAFIKACDPEALKSLSAEIRKVMDIENTMFAVNTPVPKKDSITTWRQLLTEIYILVKKFIKEKYLK